MKFTIKQLKQLIKEQVEEVKSVGKNVHQSLQEIIDGYDDDEIRGGAQNLQMIGPFVSAKKWSITMLKALADSDGKYNEFNARKIGARLYALENNNPELSFAPGRENSVVLYIAGNKESILSAFHTLEVIGADELNIMSEPSVNGRDITVDDAEMLPANKRLFIRVWWD